MNDGVEEAGAADVAAAPGVVPEPVRPLRDVKEADVGSDRLAVLADLFIAESCIQDRQEEKFRLKLRFFIKWIGQCCGPGSGIQCLFDPWIRDPGWVKSQDPG